MTAARFETQHVATTPRGWRVRTKREGGHELRIAFPPGPRKKGAGKVVEVLHPRGENPACKIKSQARSNPELLLIFGNPANPLPPESRGKVRTMLQSYHTMVRGGAKPAAAAKHIVYTSGATAAEKALFQRSARRMKPRQVNAGRKGNGHRAGCGCPICKNMRAARQGKSGPRRKAKSLRRNPDAEQRQAEKLYRDFQGKDPSAIRELQHKAVTHKNYVYLGELRSIGLDDNGLSPTRLVGKWEECDHLDFSRDGVKLASSPSGAQLYLVGGQQRLSLAGTEGVDASKDIVDLGEAYFVVYDAAKAQGNFEPIEYVHTFAEEGGERPRLLYDQLNHDIFFAGGSYRVEKPGITN